MSVTEILFYIFSAVLLVASLGVITARNPVHAALFLVFAFFNSAILWLLMEAEFLAVVLVLVYVGAVMVLFLFVVMMLDIKVAKQRARFTPYAPLGWIVTVIVIAEIASVIWANKIEFTDKLPVAPSSNTRALGELLYSAYLYPLELAAVILLVAIIAAIVLTHRKREALRVQDIAAQVAVQAKDRVRLVHMQGESE